MSKRSSPTIIGGFIVGVLVLIIAGIFVFGTNKFTSNELNYVLKFDGSVKGLDIGAPVVFRGVNVGVVSDINLVINTAGSNLVIPVNISINPSKITDAESDVNQDAGKYIHQMIKNGLKAQLQLQSLITGKLLIELEFDPENRPDHVNPDAFEIPTKQSIIKKLRKRIENLQLEEFPIEEVLHDGIRAIQAIEKILTSPDLMGTISGLNKTLSAVEGLVRNLDEKIDPITTTLQGTMARSESFVDTAETTLKAFEKAMMSSQSFFTTAESSLKAFENIASDDSGLRYQLIDSFQQLSSAARSLRVMADYLHQHPESLFYGKKE